VSIDMQKLEELKKALEAGGYNAAPGSLTQGSALQMEDLSPVMNVATFDDTAIKLQKLFKVVPAKGTLVQYNRQLDYGIFGGSAVLEGASGQEETSDYVRALVPMAYYVHVRRTTLQAQMIQAFDGVKAEDRVEADAAIKIAGDIEFSLFRGKDMYSNAGVFDGNPLAMSGEEAGMVGLDPQIRVSDSETSTQDLMMNEFGANISVVINQGGTLSQTTVEDVYAQAQMNNGRPEKIYLDPLTLGSYNKISQAMQRIVLSGSPQQATGASLKEQWVAGGALSIESSRFLSAKTSPARPRVGTPSTPSFTNAITTGSGTTMNAGDVLLYNVTAVGDLGESPATANQTVTIVTAGSSVGLTITSGGGIAPRYYNVYRTAPGQTRFFRIGKVKANFSGTTTFVDLNNRLPGGVTAFALDMRGIEIPELSAYKSVDLAMTDLSKPKAFFRFACVISKLPRFNVLIDNVTF
jgi:hypothetical protein